MVTSIKGFLFRTGLSSSVPCLYSLGGASKPGCGDTKLLSLHSRPAPSYSVTPCCHVGQPLFLWIYTHTAPCGVCDYHCSPHRQTLAEGKLCHTARPWIIRLASWNLSSSICKMDLPSSRLFLDFSILFLACFLPPGHPGQLSKLHTG